MERLSLFLFFFFNDPATTEIYTLSLHDALPILLSTSAPVAGLSTATSGWPHQQDRKSTRLNSSHVEISYAVFCLKKKTPHHHGRGRLRGHLEPAAGQDRGVPS